MSADALLTDRDVESALSIAYVQAVAAHAGYMCGKPAEPDRDSIDIQIAAGGAFRPKLDIQLKATTRLSFSDDLISYDLGIKNYNDLRILTQTPRILVVLDLPNIREQWLCVSNDSLIIKKSAYWLSLLGMGETQNTSSVRLSIPRGNTFNVESLHDLMAWSRRGNVS